MRRFQENVIRRWHEPRRAASRRKSGFTRRAFTLLELLLSLFLILVILVMVYRFYQSSMMTREAGSEVAKEVMTMRAILSGIAEDIRHTVDQVPGDSLAFRGTEEKITIVRLRMPENYAFEEHESIYDDLPPMQKDLVRIQYHLLEHPELEDENGEPLVLGLWRNEQKRFDPNPSFVVEENETEEGLDGFDELEEMDDSETEEVPMMEGEMIAPEVKYLKFEYFDGVQWRDRWQVAYEAPDTGGEDASVDPEAEAEEGENVEIPAVSQSGIGGVGYALPQAVRVTIGLVPMTPEEKDMASAIMEDRQEEEELLEHYGDRYQIVVSIPIADPTLLSSVKHGLENQPDLQMGGQ